MPMRETTIIYENGYHMNRFNALIDKEVTKERIRAFARSPFCRRAINITKNGFLSLPWTVEKRDLTDTKDYSQEINRVIRCLRNPNYTNSFRELYNSVAEDILTGDCGAVEVCVGSDTERPIWLYPVDGYTLQIRADWIHTPKDIRFIQRQPDGTEVKLADEDIMYHKLNNFSYTPLGTSPVETAYYIINYLLEAQRYAGTAASNAIPKFILNLGKDCDELTLNKFRKYFAEEVYGSGKLPLVGGSDGVKGEQIAAASDDGLYLQWQHFLVTIIAYSFNIDPKRFNEGSQTDRSTVDEQKENILEEAVKPLAEVVSENINKKVLGRLGLSDALVFRFIYEDNEVRKKQKTDRVLAEFNGDLLTLNEARQMLGYSKVTDELTEYGDMLKSQYKTALNTKYALETQAAGGFNGVGKNRYDGGE